MPQSNSLVLSNAAIKLAGSVKYLNQTRLFCQMPQSNPLTMTTATSDPSFHLCRTVPPSLAAVSRRMIRARGCASERFASGLSCRRTQRCDLRTLLSGHSVTGTSLASEARERPGPGPLYPRINLKPHKHDPGSGEAGAAGDSEAPCTCTAASLRDGWLNVTFGEHFKLTEGVWRSELDSKPCSLSRQGRGEPGRTPKGGSVVLSAKVCSTHDTQATGVGP
eukprot:3715790-Rhodomonas_salina.1